MARIRRLLVPMDGSPLSERALRVALEEYPDAAVTVLHVVDPTEPGYSYPVDVDLAEEPRHGSAEWYERADELTRELFDEVRSVAEAHDREIETESVEGDPRREIVRLASERDVDQIVIGSHGRSADEVLLLGSVTEAVVFRSPVRVLLVR